MNFCDSHIPRLISTPPLIMGELQRGYLLRLVELNGYESITTLAMLAGLSTNAARAGVVPILPLAPLLYRNDNEQNRLFNAFTNDCPVPLRPYLDIKAAKLCPLCIQEYGYLQQFWGLAHAVACPIHHCRPLTHCPSCQRKITWTRPGLTTCHCGHDFLQASGTKVECEATLALQYLLHAKCQQEQFDLERLKTVGFPLDELGRLDLSSLLKLTRKLGGQLSAEACGDPGYKYLHDIRVTAMVLADWPRGFHAYLDQTSLKPSAAHSALGLRAQNERLYGALFKNSLPDDEVAFLKRSFFNWAGGQQHPALLHPCHASQLGTSLPRYVGVNEAAKHIGVRVPTVKTLIKLGILDAQRGGDGHSWLINTESGLPLKNTQADSLSAREAARWLGLPQTVIEQLRQTRVLRITCIPERSSSFSLHDLELFRSRMQKCSKPPRDLSKRYSLADILRMKHGGPMIRAELIAAVLDGSLDVFGKPSTKLGELRLERSAVNAFIDVRKTRRDWLTPFEASKLICCDPLVLDALVEREHLVREMRDGKLLISHISISMFISHYTPLAELGREVGTSSAHLSQYCRDHDIPLLNAPRRGKDSAQPFIHSEHLIRLEPLVGAPLLRARAEVSSAPTCLLDEQAA